MMHFRAALIATTLPLFPILTPNLAFADTITAQIKPTDVTVYPYGATVSRQGQIDLPAGHHEIVLPNLGNAPEFDITLSGATIISRQWHQNTPGPRPAPDTATYRDAKAQLDAAQNALDLHNDKITATRRIKEANLAQIAFLAELINSRTLPDGVDSLRDLSRMIAEETLAAQTAILQSDVTLRDLLKEVKPLAEAVATAQRALDTLLPPEGAVGHMILNVEVPQATASDVSVTYFTQEASWQPTYKMNLTTTGNPRLNVERSAAVTQSSHEHWSGVNLILSTQTPADKNVPWTVTPQYLQLIDPSAKIYARRLEGASADKMNMPLMAEPMIEAMDTMEVVAMDIDLSGIAAQYTFDYKVNVPSQESVTHITMGSMGFDADITALAVPLNEKTAYRVARFTNTEAERLLPSSLVSLYVDDRLVANTHFAGLVPSDETEIGFGPIHGLTLKRTVLNRSEGDRGIISRSNEKSEQVRIDVENLTDQDWSIRLVDRVPYAEQEDLEIDWTASPRPSTVDYEDRRGILNWEFPLGGAMKQSITIDTTITWPDGKVVQ